MLARGGVHLELPSELASFPMGLQSDSHLLQTVHRLTCNQLQIRLSNDDIISRHISSPLVVASQFFIGIDTLTRGTYRSPGTRRSPMSTPSSKGSSVRTIHWMLSMPGVFTRETRMIRAAARTAIFFLKILPMLPSRPVDWVTKAPVHT